MRGKTVSRIYIVTWKCILNHSISLDRFTFVVNINVDVHFDLTKVYFEISPGN